MKTNDYLCVLVFLVTIVFSNCINTRRYDFSLKNTVSIFLLNNERNYYFCIPIQYTGDYQIKNFEFTGGNILIGDYEFLLQRDEINIYVYLNEEAADPFGISAGEFNLVYSEESGRILISEMNKPLTVTHDSDEIMNHYYIFIEKHLKDDDMKNIIGEYKKGNVYSKTAVWYDITIENEEQKGSGMLDNFELYNGPFIDTAQFFPNLDFFRAKYLQK